MNPLSEHDKDKVLQFLLTVYPITENDFLLLSQKLRKKYFKKGDIILNLNQKETKNSFVLSGIIHQYVIIDGNIVTMDITLPGMIYSSVISYVEDEESRQMQVALTDVEVLCIEKNDMEELFATVPSITYIYYKVLERVHVEREKRTLLLQNRSAVNRFEGFIKNLSHAEYFLREVPQKLIASYLNLTPETYSRVRKEYLKKCN